MRTKYLFNEDKAMTPLSQMQATKELLTEGQRIAYVGLCHLVAKKMVRDAGRGWQGVIKKSLKGKEKAIPAQEDAGIWMIKIMARLYQHMELEPAGAFLTACLSTTWRVRILISEGAKGCTGHD
jgi:hypothetical protein